MPVSINGSTGITGAINIQAAGSVLTGVTTITDNSTTGLVISGIATVSAGSTSAPSIAPSGDTNTGLFFPSADTIAFTSGGTERGRWISGGGLTFNGDTATANALSDYEEGTWTPNLENTSGTGLGSSYNTRAGAYTKIGNVVYWNAYIDVGTNNASCTGNMRISGFPYSIKGAPSYADGFYIGFIARVGSNIIASMNMSGAYASSTTLDLFYLNAGGGESRVQGGSDLVNPHIHMSGFYYVS